MSKHTPGPWFHYDDTPRRIHGHEIAATGKTVARIYCTKGDEAEDAANARLIAAAPALYSFVASMAASGDDDAIEIMEAINGNA